MGRLIGVLPTYRRSQILVETLRRLGEQERALDVLIVVDNEGNPDTEAAVRQAVLPAEYIRAPENLGCAGGIELGMRVALERASEEDWIVVLDDDDPPRFRDAFARLEQMADELAVTDSRLAAVGISGNGFDWRRGRIRRIPDELLTGPVRVEHLAGNQLPMYRAEVIRREGPSEGALFFGFDDLELGLRLTRAGYSLYGHGSMWMAGRRSTGRLGRTLRPDHKLPSLEWRRYYSLRNLIFLLRRFDHRLAAVRITLLAGLGKPIVGMALDPGLALGHLRLNARACFDAWTGRMGRRVEPDGGVRSHKALPRPTVG